MTDTLLEIAKTFGTPCYVYDMDRVRERVDLVRTAFGNRFRIGYAAKCNPNPGVLRRMKRIVDQLDVSSSGEILAALDTGWSPSTLGFTGPGKTRDELQLALGKGVGEVILESVAEAELLNELAEETHKTQPVLVRIAPSTVPRGFGLNLSGKPTQFGVDENEIDSTLKTIMGLRGLDLRGFHIYSGTQCLRADAIAENYKVFIEIFRRICHTHGLSPQKLIFGSGIGIPYYDNDVAVDLLAVAEMTNPALDILKSDPIFSATKLVLESGRYLVGEAGIYVTRVIRKKVSHGTAICICDGGMNHHLAAAGHLGSLLQRNYQMFKITEDSGQGEEHEYDLVGPLCTTIDTLGRKVRFNGLAAGDLIGIASSGAYGVTASPIHFISHAPPKEIIVETRDGELVMEDSSQFSGQPR